MVDIVGEVGERAAQGYVRAVDVSNGIAQMSNDTLALTQFVLLFQRVVDNTRLVTNKALEIMSKELRVFTSWTFGTFWMSRTHQVVTGKFIEGNIPGWGERPNIFRATSTLSGLMLDLKCFFDLIGDMKIIDFKGIAEKWAATPFVKVFRRVFSGVSSQIFRQVSDLFNICDQVRAFCVEGRISLTGVLLIISEICDILTTSCGLYSMGGLAAIFSIVSLSTSLTKFFIDLQPVW